MTDSEKFRKSLEYKSDEELNYLRYRASGRTTRLIDEFVQDFFNRPMGTKIHIRDHYGFRRSDNDRASALLIDKLRARIENEHHLECKAGKDNDGFYIIRETQTVNELVLEEIERRKENG
jgi:hypothetical protein